MKRKQARPTAKIPSRTHSSDKSEAATGLSTPGSDPEPREPLPLRQEEDLEPSTAEHPGEEAGAVHVSVWGGGAELHSEGFPRAGAGPGPKSGLTPPIFHTAVREGILCWVFFWILWEAFCPWICNDKAGLWVMFSPLTALKPAFKVNQAPLSSPVPTAVVAPGAGPRDPLKGDRDLRLPFPKTPG